jgi:hypothetical protein
MPHRLKEWQQAALTADRKALCVTGSLEDGQTIQFELPFQLVAQLVEGVALAGQTSAQLSNNENDPSSEIAGETLILIPVRGLGLSTGRAPSESALVVDLFRTRLAFLLDSKKVAALGASFAQAAATLSADPSIKM